jgi:hypothetical protein
MPVEGERRTPRACQCRAHEANRGRDSDGGEQHEPATFSTWCPKLLALIGTLPETLTDRAIVIPMRRKASQERVERLRLDRLPALCLPLRRQLRRWADDSAHVLASADPIVSEALHDRAADNWRPLLAIADAAGGDWPARARAAALTLSGAELESSTSAQLLADCQAVFDDEGVDVLASSTLVRGLLALDDRPWGEWRHGRPLTANGLARMLRAFGVVPAGTVRLGDRTAKAYRRAAFEDAWTRYLPIEPSQRNDLNKTGPEDAIVKGNTQKPVTVADPQVSPIDSGVCDGVTVQTPVTGANGEVPHSDYLWRDPEELEAANADDSTRY